MVVGENGDGHMVSPGPGHPPRHHRRDPLRPAGVVQAGRCLPRGQLLPDHRRRRGAAAHVREKAAELGLTPRARIRSQAVVGVDPVTMLKGPIPSTAKVLARAGLQLSDIDLFEVNEAFAPVVLAWERSTIPTWTGSTSTAAPSPSAIPSAPRGRLMTTLLHEMERSRPPARPRDDVLRRRYRHRHDHRPRRLRSRPGVPRARL